MSHKFKKITPVNGFDRNDPINARQNNYAWSMEELGAYLYVGTARNVVYGVLKSGLFGDIAVPPELDVPADKVDFSGEIWRWKKDGSRDWERVYKPAGGDLSLGIMGFRFMITYKQAIYAGALSLNNKVVILKSTTGENGSWKVLSSDTIQHGDSTRAMVIHKDKLYLSVMGTVGASKVPYLYESTDPENLGWTQVEFDPGNSPNGEIISLLSFNDRLYVGTGQAGGFEVWRTNGPDPRTGGWTMVVDKGAGDALNELAMSMEAFKNNIYIGSGIWLAITSEDPNIGIVPPKGIDLIRLDKNDNWELVVGGPPVIPTEPTTGHRNLALYPSGFGDLSNAYCWQIRKYDGDLYVGTWDWSILIPSLIRGAIIANTGADVQITEDLLNKIKVKDLLKLKIKADEAALQQSITDLPLSYFLALGLSLVTMFKTFGFDMYKSSDGAEWKPITLTGLRHPHNYGLRMLFPSRNGNLYLGTANPFDGCEVWVKKGEDDDEEEENEHHNENDD